MIDRVVDFHGTEALPFSDPGRAERVEVLTRVCATDLLDALGLGAVSERPGSKPLKLAARVPARRLARQATAYDEIVGREGLRAGGAWALSHLARGLEVTGREGLPDDGPVLVVSNHPGLGDSMALFASIHREDLRVVAAERRFLQALPNTSRRLITFDESSPERLGVVRSAVRHLRRGGAVLTFPGGRIEPDPAVLPGATEALGRWSASVDLFARLAPELTIVPAIVSGVISPTALRSPLTYLRRQERDRRWLAATLQMLVPALRDVVTRVDFGRPVAASEPGSGSVSERVTQEARRLVEQRSG
ncbi:MAG: 1-acyl-sn-glycerol-3-phosphate acyltransferase [Rubrobacter sp.]|nr:1-acyl-sn-glycerol-3-phosphate acyltransferase [Rubrobacter sp.]